MNRYRFRAVAADGLAKSGRVWARSTDDARRALVLKDLCPVELTPSHGTQANASGRASERLAVIRALAKYIDAGASVRQSVDAATQMGVTRALGDDLQEVASQVAQGEMLSTSLERVGLLDDRMSALVRSGENAGNLGDGLRIAADELAHEMEVLARFQAALTYPVILAVMAVASVGVIMLVVLPRYATIIRDLGATPSGLTSVVLNLSVTISAHKSPLAVLLIACGGLGWVAAHSPSVRHRVRSIAAAMPVVRTVTHVRRAAHVARALGAMLAAGITISRALRTMERYEADAGTGAALRSARELLEGGASLSAALVPSGLLPSSASLFLQVAERTGDTAGALTDLSQQLEQEAAARLETVLTLVQPVIILVFGGLIAGAAAIVLQALYSVRPGLQS